MAKYPQMSAEEFEAKQDRLTKMSVQTNQLARLILVDGLNNAEAARTVRMSRQNVSKHMARVIARLNDMPADYEHLDLWVPAALAKETRAKLRSIEEERQAKENVIPEN